MNKTKLAIMSLLMAVSYNANSAGMKFNLHILNDNNSLFAPFNPTSINNNGQIVSFASVYDFSSNSYTNIWDIDPSLASFNPIEINNNGDMAGMDFSGGMPAAASYVAEKLNTYGNEPSIAEGINNNGTIVTWIPGNEVIHKDGTSTSLQPIPNGGNGSALAINDNNYSVGNALNNKYESEAVLWDPNGNATVLTALIDSVLGSRSNGNQAYDINNINQVVGQSRGEAVMWDNGSVIALNDISGIGIIESNAHAINDLGWIVGDLGLPYAGGHGFLWKDGAMLDLNDYVLGLPTDWHISSAVDINNKGFIIGMMSNDKTSESIGYVLSPIPEPSTYAMLMLGLGLIGVVGRRGIHI